MKQLVVFFLNLSQIGKSMTALTDAVSALTASVAALTGEVTIANSKVDQLIVLAQNAGAPQDQIDAILAAKTAADAATTALQSEDAKIDPVLGTPAG